MPLGKSTVDEASHGTGRSSLLVLKGTSDGRLFRGAVRDTLRLTRSAWLAG